MDQTTRLRAQELREEINGHNNRYFNEDSPIISDPEYDKLKRELIELERLYPELVTDDSPTQRVGGTALRGEKVMHMVPMLSLEDMFTIERVNEFIATIQNKSPDASFIVEEKIDGLSISLEYQNGKFVRAVTRGDGITGEDVTDNVAVIKSLPHSIPFAGTLIVRAEIYMPKSSFLTANAARKQQEKSLYTNPRNCASGTIRGLDPEVVSQRELDLFAFNIQRIDKENQPITSHEQSRAFLKMCGFPVCPAYGPFTEVSNITTAIDKIGSARDGLLYGIDGAVIKVDSLILREQLGATSSHPKWAAAYKYPAAQEQTVVQDIEETVGRTGRITPVAIITPVLIDGTTVSRATLHNPDHVKELGICIGDTIVIQKAGDIIPQVVKVIKDKRPVDAIPYQMPDECPVCGAKTGRLEGEANLFCQGDASCPAQFRRAIQFFASKDCMDIYKLGPSTVDALIEAGFVTCISDIYKIKEKRSELIAANVIGGEKTVDNLIRAIEESKNRELSRLIKGLGGENVGKHVGEILAKQYGNIENIKKATYEELIALDDIGDSIAKEIVRLFSDSYVCEQLEIMASYGVVMEASTKDSNGSAALKDYVFVVTGTLPTLKRKEAEKLITDHGGKLSGSVSSKTSYVVAGDDPGSKLSKAQSLGIPVIDESDLLNLIRR